MIRLALTKGRLEKKVVELLEGMGYDTVNLQDKGRKLIIQLPDAGLEIVLVKSADVITYVERGACDAGVVGKDTIMETGGAYYEVLDLGFGKCGFALAAKKGADFWGGFNVKRIATKYPNVARKFFEQKTINVDIIKIEGSVELAPLIGLADGIVDIVETGATLKANGLEVIEEISQVSARLIVNTASMKLKKAELDRFIEQMKGALNA